MVKEDRAIRLFGKKVFVAFIDILGFKDAIKYDEVHGIDHQNTIFTLWENAFIPQRQKLISHQENILNFAQFSDCIVFYGTDPVRLVDLVCDFYGWVFAWGVPVRGGLGYGRIYHSDSLGSLGSAIMLNGSGLIDAYSTEQSGKGLGMRLFASESFVKETKDIFYQTLDNGKVEVPWWFWSGHNYEYFIRRSSDWWKKKNVGKWFTGTHREDTKIVFETAVKDLKTQSIS